MAKKKSNALKGYETYSGKSWAKQLLAGTWLGNLLYGPEETYTDGYGHKRKDASFSESANGQEAKRMAETAKDAAKISAMGLAFGNPLTAGEVMAPLITGAQAYMVGEGLNDAQRRVNENLTTKKSNWEQVGDAAIVGLDLLGSYPALKSINTGWQQVAPELEKGWGVMRNYIKNTAADVARGNIHVTTTPVENVTRATAKVTKSAPYARVAPSDGRINTAWNYYFSDDPKNYFQLIKDTEPENYSIHFKTNRGAYSSDEVQNIINTIAKDLPEGSNISTWGTVSKGGFSGLNRFKNAGFTESGTTRKLFFKDPSAAKLVAEKYGVTLNSDGTVNWPVLQKVTQPTPSKITAAERLGIPKGERNSMSRNQKEALEDLEYLLETDNKNKFVIRNGKPTYVSENKPGDISVIQDMLNKGATYNEHSGFSLKTPEGFVRVFPAKSIDGRGTFGYIAGNFPTQWGDATVMPIGSRYQKIILTSPYTDAMTNGGLTVSAGEGISKIIPKEVMKGFWKNIDTYTKPGTYLSGDEGSLPMGAKLYELWKNRNSVVKIRNNDGILSAPTRGGNLKTFYNMLTTPEKIKSRTEGLSADSYIAILKQGNRPGHKLRFSNDGFTEFNHQGIENKFISDMLEKAKVGEIPKQDFVRAFNDWVKPYNGESAIIKNGEIIIPHPFVLYKNGGKLNDTISTNNK